MCPPAPGSYLTIQVISLKGDEFSGGTLQLNLTQWIWRGPEQRDLLWLIEDTCHNRYHSRTEHSLCETVWQTPLLSECQSQAGHLPVKPSKICCLSSGGICSLSLSLPISLSQSISIYLSLSLSDFQRNIKSLKSFSLSFSFMTISFHL